jgi:hypothetical protein
MQALILGVVATLLNVMFYVFLFNFPPRELGLGLTLVILVWVTLAHSGASLRVAALALQVKRLLLPRSSA